MVLLFRWMGAMLNGKQIAPLVSVPRSALGMGTQVGAANPPERVPQRRGDSALTRGQDRAHQQELGHLPGRVGRAIAFGIYRLATPAQAGVQRPPNEASDRETADFRHWIPAFAGMTVAGRALSKGRQLKCDCLGRVGEQRWKGASVGTMASGRAGMAGPLGRFGSKAIAIGI